MMWTCSSRLHRKREREIVVMCTLLLEAMSPVMWQTTSKTIHVCIVWKIRTHDKKTQFIFSAKLEIAQFVVVSRRKLKIRPYTHLRNQWLRPGRRASKKELLQNLRDWELPQLCSYAAINICKLLLLLCYKSIAV